MVNQSTHIAKKLGIRLIIITAFLVGFNHLYTTYFWTNDLDKHGPLLHDLIEIKDTCDVIYFGESSNFTTHPDDYNQLRISDNIATHFPSLRFGTLNHGAYHVGMYKPLVGRLQGESKPNTIIVTMNLRTFNQDVIYGPSEANLRLASRLYEPQPPLLNRALVSLNYYDNRSGHERDLLKWKAWTYDTLVSTSDSITFEKNTIRRWCEIPKFVDSAGIQDDAKRQLADQYIKAYAFQIDDDNPMVQEFDALVANAKENNLKVVFNLIPENVEDAKYYIGENLVILMRQNRDYLVARYSQNDVMVIDNLELLPSKHFLDRKLIPQEHYDAAGREAIGNNVAIHLKNYLTKVTDPE